MSTVDVAWSGVHESRFDENSFTWAWILAAATYGVGDVVTTIAIVYFHPLYTEGNPLIREAITAFGGGGFLGLKLLVFYICIGVSVWGGLSDDDPVLFYGPPLALAVAGVATTWINLGLLL